MGDHASAPHLRQTKANIDGDGRLTEGEKETARALANLQSQQLSDGVEATPETWDLGRLTALRALSMPAAAIVPRTPDERLGHLFTMRSFQRTVAHQFGCDSDEARRLIDLWLAAAQRKLNVDEQSEVDVMRERVRLRSREIWVFQNDVAANDAYHDLTLNDLPCALGLPYARGEAFVAFNIPFAVVPDARRPCVYDVTWSFQEFWRSSGRTLPICSQRTGAAGHLEWVATAPLMSEVDATLSVGVVDDCAAAGADAYDA